MGLFSRKPTLAEPNVPAGWLDEAKWRGWDPPRNLIRGESHYQAALRKACGMRRPRDQGYLKPVCLDLVREPDNEYDRNALAAHIDSRLVGHLGREFAARIAPVLDKHKIKSVRLCGVIRGGTPGAPNLGVHVWMDRRPVAGPLFTHGDSSHIVPWPPFDGEGLD